ncbi:cell division protein FtsA [Bombilactobacillus thymidiniphilus]|uniref:Cell division protein FtsA n=1 Tax=Bombilactobacillus thymidiniphilus TaxID=2923363 RepID=A0ABY4PDZ9_9LACO|nr:cell division protein FtsA [Bombilactobacillus thymidiniphilus]UQS83790.1 cell division protein FtsA [Bombilactobacillus thymidiniphilus]
MDDSRIIVSLDIGTTSMKVVVANIVKGRASIVGVGSAHSQGMSRGVIVDIDKASAAISQAVKKAASQSNTEINDVIIGLPANGLQMFKTQSLIALNEQSKEIDDEDVKRVIKASLGKTLAPDLEFVALIPGSFGVDGFKNIKDPRGMIGNRLEFTGVLYALPKSIIHNSLKAVQRAGLNVVYEVLAPVAIGEVALDKGERDFGTTIIDLGGGQTTAAIIHENQLKFAAVDPEGGNLVASDVSTVLNTTLDSANKLQRYYGNAEVSLAVAGEEFPVEIVGQEDPKNVSSKYLAEIIEARLQQIFERLRSKLNSVEAIDLPGGVVLTGGLAAMPGIDQLAKKLLNTKVKIFIPNQMGLRHPAFTEGLGLVLYAQGLNDLDMLAYDIIHQSDVQPEIKQESAHKMSTKATGSSKKKIKSEKIISTSDKIKNFWGKFFD